MAGLFEVLDGAQAAGAGALRGLKDTKVPMVITAIAYWLIGLPLAYLLGITWGGGPQGLWGGLFVGLLCAATLLNWRFYRVTTAPRLATEVRRPLR
jgi:MATE family multidrug resistance protein